MKKPWTTAFAVLLFVAATSCQTKIFSPAEYKLSEELTVTEIAQGEFLVTHSYPWPANSLIAKLTEKDFVWIGTPYTPEATARTLDWLAARYGRDIKLTEINTGFHIDNLGGNAEFVKRSIPVYGSTRSCELVKTRNPKTMATMQEWLKAPELKKYREAYRDFVFVEPSIKYDLEKGLILEFGKERVEVFFPGPTHAYDNTVVYIPGRKLLFGGCMILAAEAKKPGYADDGNLEEWPKSVKKVIDRFGDAEIVVPGHGKIGDRSLLAHTVEIVEQARAK